MNLPAIES